MWREPPSHSVVPFGSTRFSLRRRQKKYHNSEDVQEKFPPVHVVTDAVQDGARFIRDVMKPLDTVMLTEHEDQGASSMDTGRDEIVAEELQKPNIPCPVLIAMALLDAPLYRLTVSDIYAYIQARFPYYSVDRGPGWKGSIRHKLSLDKVCERKMSIFVYIHWMV